jgi:predicted DsbA family dithiol-disulfide isomerase
MSAESSQIPIDLIGDVASAECYIGLRLIDAVVASVPGLVVDVRWRPFQIDPDLPPEGQDRAAYLEDKLGSPEEVRESLASLAESAREFGLELEFDKIQRQPNTLEAHRVVRFAREFDLEIRMVEALFAAFLLEGQDIGDRATLIALAARIGMPAAVVADFLGGASDIEALRQELTGFRALGVEHVPRFIIAGKKTISGIVSTEDFADALFGSIEDE